MKFSSVRLSLLSALALMSLVSGQALADVVKLRAELKKFEHVPNEVVVKVASNKMAIRAFRSDPMILSADAFETDPSFLKLTLKSRGDLAAEIERLAALPGVEYAEPNYIFHAIGQANTMLTPNDPRLGQLWGLNNVGQADAAGQVGIAGADISATRAWSIARGSDRVTVAVIDTGIDYNHPDLAANMYRNPGESGDGKETNGIDDDGDGFVDNVYGWNFAGVSTNNPMDDNSHGTHCAGTIGGVADNGIGVTGVAWNVRLMPVKFLSANGGGSLADAVKSIQYATKMGVQIMSNSWGGGPYTQALYDAIKGARDRGILFIAAAGNDGENGDVTAHYPSAYQLSNVIAVAATDNQDRLASFSNYGKRTVHIAAPGVKIWSTTPNNSYAAYSGTSMATPHVAGAAAVVWGYLGNPNFSDVKTRLVNSRDPLPGLSRKIASGGRMNLYQALMGIYPPALEPSESEWINGTPIGVIESAHPYENNANLEWTFEAPVDARYIRFRVAQADLEAGYDNLRIFDANGVESDSISGVVNSPTYSWFVIGNKAKIRLTSDSSVTRWGFKIDGFQYIPR